MSAIKTYCYKGWPVSKNQCDDLAKPYFHIRDEISVSRGIVFKGACIIIPQELRKSLLDKIHEGHFGFEKCYSLSRNVLYWPNLRADIKNKVENCEICLRYKRNNSKQPLMPHDPVTVPFGKIAVDLADFDGKKILVVADYFSGFFEVIFLNSTTAEVIINSLKSIFARFGIPMECVCDNGPPFSSAKFVEFAKEWDFKLSFSSPNFPRSNGFIERNIQTAKRMLSKAKDSKTDYFMSLLHYRNASKNSMSSPAQLLMSRNLRSNLPCTEEFLAPRVVNLKKHVNDVTAYKKKMKEYFDKNAHNLPNPKVGEQAFFKKQPDSLWLPCTILSKCNEPRSYVVKHGNGIYRRNREHILLRARDQSNDQVKEQVANSLPKDSKQKNEINQSVTIPSSSERTTRDANSKSAICSTKTRSGRNVVMPKRFSLTE